MNSKTLARFPRRRLLKGLTLGAGGALLAPMLERMAWGVDGHTPPPRFLFVLEGNGLPPEQVHPLGLPFTPRADRQEVRVESLAELKLPRALEPLEAHKHRMAIVQGLSCRIAAGGHSNDQGALGAYNANDGRNIQDRTVDAVLGQDFPGVYANVVLGIASDPNESVIFNCSASAPGRGLPTICQPMIAFEHLFGSVAVGSAAASFAAKRNLLDHMREDIRRVRAELGSIEKEKLDAYLSAYETLGRTSDRLVESRDRLAAAVPAQDDKYASRVETDRLDAHFELAAAAMIGGLTNVATIASGVGFPYFNVVYGGLGITTPKHNIGHDVLKGNMTATDMAVAIRRFHFELIARFMRTLESVPEGDGSMLDNTVVVYLSDAAEAHHSYCWEWPFVIVGDLSGRLKTAGQYVSYPDYGRSRHRATNALYNTLLHAAGIPRDDFGGLDPNLDTAMCRGPLDELLG